LDAGQLAELLDPCNPLKLLYCLEVSCKTPFKNCPSSLEEIDGRLQPADMTPETMRRAAIFRGHLIAAGGFELLTNLLRVERIPATVPLCYRHEIFEHLIGILWYEKGGICPGQSPSILAMRVVGFCVEMPGSTR
jgi:hypothetical protein